MYGKVMSLPDVSAAVDPTGEAGGEEGRRYTVIDYFDYLTDVPDHDLEEMRHAMDGGTVNPMGLKNRLAHDLVTQFHGAADARDAEGYFERTVQRKEVPDDIQTYALPDALADKRISDVILGAGLAKSSADARRLINQGAVRVNEQAISTNAGAVTMKPGDIVRVGRRRMVRIA
jgi:tyrosyl-tRNA synthetase